MCLIPLRWDFFCNQVESPTFFSLEGKLPCYKYLPKVTGIFFTFCWFLVVLYKKHW